MIQSSGKHTFHTHLAEFSRFCRLNSWDGDLPPGGDEETEEAVRTAQCAFGCDAKALGKLAKGDGNEPWRLQEDG